MKTKSVKAFTLIEGDKLLLRFDATHSGVREITKITPIKNGSGYLYSITCMGGTLILCGAQKKQKKVISK